MATERANVADLVATAAVTAPAKPALRWPDGSLTWAELAAQVDGLAHALAARGVTPGQRVAIVLPNTVEFAVGYFAVLRAGAVAVPLNPAYTEPELAVQLSDSDAVLVLTDAAHAGLVGDRTVLDIGSDEWQAALRTKPDGAALPARGGDDLAVLLYTAGTSGRPKGAMLSHGALLANLDQLSRVEPPVVQSSDVVLLVLPLFHVYALNAGLAMTARAAATGVLVDRFDPVETLATVKQERVTNVIGAPTIFVAWSMLPELRESFAGVRLAVSGAAPLPAAVLTAFRDSTGKQIYEGYGLTETAPVLTTTLCSTTLKPGSIGRPLPGVELQLVDDEGDEVDDDDPGEIVVRGANVFSGYWPDGSGGADEDGWFHTGDVAYADDDGDLFLVDRLRELILVSGFNVYPREVEDAIATHPEVAEVAVVGAPHPYTGETVRALVVPRTPGALTADDVIAHAGTRLARFKCPTSVEIVAELPHSVAGKVAKGKLRA
jgi:long-chain acyl-CoA synthetase